MYKLHVIGFFQVDIHLSSICEALIEILETASHCKATCLIIREGGAKGACHFRVCTNNVGFVLKCVNIKLYRLLNEVRGVVKEACTCYHNNVHVCISLPILDESPCTIVQGLWPDFGATLKFLKKSNFDRNQLKLSTQHKYMYMYHKKL